MKRIGETSPVEGMPARLHAGGRRSGGVRRAVLTMAACLALLNSGVRAAHATSLWAWVINEGRAIFHASGGDITVSAGDSGFAEPSVTVTVEAGGDMSYSDTANADNSGDVPAGDSDVNFTFPDD